MIFILTLIVSAVLVFFCVVLRKEFLAVIAIIVWLPLLFFVTGGQKPDFSEEVSKDPVIYVTQRVEQREFLVELDRGQYHETLAYSMDDIAYVDSTEKSLTNFKRFYTNNWVLPWDRTDDGRDSLRFPASDIVIVD